MKINNVSGCCAVGEIAYIANDVKENGPEGCVEQFIKLECLRFSHYAEDGTHINYFYKPQRRFYIFTGVEASTTNPDYYVGYATKLARYIKANKLGHVVRTRAETNHAIHPDHVDRVFVWSPDHETLKAWWEKRHPRIPKPEPKPIFSDGPSSGGI